MVILNDSDQARDLGYHELTDEGLPLGKVFVKTCQAQGVSWTVTASHELLEMLGDPEINLSVLRDEGESTQSLVAYEICDACEADELGYKIGDVLVSDFVFPSWFEFGHEPSISQFDHCGKITAAFQCLPGGYLTSMPVGPSAKWQQVEVPSATGARLASRSGWSEIVGTRRQRRRSHSRWKRTEPKVRSRRAAMHVRRRGLYLVNNGADLAIPTAAGNLEPVADQILKARAAIAQMPVQPGTARNIQQASAVLDAALAQVQKINKTDHLAGSVPDDYELSLVMSALHNTPAPALPIRTLDLAGGGQYESRDVRWAESLIERVITSRVPFPNHIQGKITPVIRIPNQFKIAIAGDWGTGNASSRAIAEKITKVNPDCTIHLGDVYYAGTDPEEHTNFLGLWPAGSSATAPSFALNGNHEMYSGGGPYFTDVLTLSTQFRAQQRLSYFALTNDRWLILGVDTAYYAESNTYQRGDLGTLQSDWIKQMAERARAAKQRIILLTHHNGIDIGDDGTQVSYQQPLWNQVKSALGGVPDYWYWGHVHAGIAFQPYSVNGRKVIARCVGHGGIPYAPFGPANGLGDSQIRVEWAEFATAGDPEEPRRALNGFVLLTLDDEKIGEQFLDEKGNPRFPPVGPE